MLDEFDRKLLEQVQRDNRLTANELSESVGLSPSACQRRLKRLRDDGIIVSDVSILSPGAVGRRLTMIVQVTLVRERPDLIDAFKASMRGTPEVMQCYYVTGDADFVLLLTVPEMEDYEAFIQRFFLGNANIKRFTTMVVMEPVKTGMQIPVWD